MLNSLIDRFKKNKILSVLILVGICVVSIAEVTNSLEDIVRITKGFIDSDVRVSGPVEPYEKVLGINKFEQADLTFYETDEIEIIPYDGAGKVLYYSQDHGKTIKIVNMGEGPATLELLSNGKSFYIPGNSFVLIPWSLIKEWYVGNEGVLEFSSVIEKQRHVWKALHMNIQVAGQPPVEDRSFTGYQIGFLECRGCNISFLEASGRN